MPIGKIQLLQQIYRQIGPVWVDDIDPVWITVAPKGSLQYTEITVLYSDSTFGYR